MATTVELPPGFVLDETRSETGLPSGFQLDAPSVRERTESSIASRESAIPLATRANTEMGARFGRSAVQRLLSPSANARSVVRLADPGSGVQRFRNLSRSLQEVGQTTGANLGAAQEVAESLTASPFVSLQAGRSVGADLGKVLKGERVVERGDIARNLGAPEPVAALFGLATSPEAVIPGVLGARAAGKAAGGVQQTLRLGRPATILKPNPLREQVVRRVQQRLLKAPKLAGRAFEHGLEDAVKANPTQSVDLSTSLGSYLTKAQQNPAFKSLIQRQALNHQESGLVQSLLNQPEIAANLTLKDSQTIKQIFQRVNRQRFQQVDPEFLGAHLDALEVWHDIRLAQLQAFPQFKTVMNGYAEAMNHFRVVKNALKEGALEPQLLSNFSANSQKIRAFRELATPDTMRLVERFLKATATRKFVRRLGIGAAAVTALEVGRRTVGSSVSRLFGLGQQFGE